MLLVFCACVKCKLVLAGEIQNLMDNDISDYFGGQISCWF